MILKLNKEPDIFYPILKKFGHSRDILIKVSLSDFAKIRTVETKFYHEDKRGGWADATKLKGAFLDYANGLKRSKIRFRL
jgi:hypothetical protein